MPRLFLHLLGSPRFAHGGAPIEIERRKAVALVSYLAVTRESHSRNALAALLWPEYSEVSARAALGTTLWALKKALGPDWFTVDRESVSLNGGSDLWVDVRQFRVLLGECETHDHAPKEVCPACLPALTSAAELYRDDFLAGFTLRDSANFDDWQLFQTESLRRELSKVLEKLVRGHSTQEQFEPAITFARRWLALEPLHEPAHRHLMRLYAWTGQRAAALRQYEECQRTLQEELNVPPQQKTVQLYQDIRENRVTSPSSYPVRSWAAPARAHHLPAQPTPFLGRENELADVTRLLENPACRLLTLSGPGGVGKTRLSIQAAAENARHFSDGVYFVALANLDSAADILPAVGQALECPIRDGFEDGAYVLEYLQDKDVLLVLDNVEHLPQGVGLLVELLRAAPGVKLIATSLERLNLQWEWVLEVRGLDYPEVDAAEPMESYSAVQLFLQRAQRIQPSFRLHEADRTHVARVTRYLEGMPLGIELAATWTQVLTCEEIARRMERDLDFLSTSLRDVPERHRSLRAVFDHSWRLLSEGERRVFSRLSAFRGGFRREAAEQVAGASLSILSNLVRKSFLRRTPSGRYETIEVMRRYMEEELGRTRQDREAVHHLHSAYYARFLGERAPRLLGKEQKQALAEIEEELDNLRAAWQWAVQHDRLAEIEASLEGLYLFFDIQSWFQEGNQLLGEAVDGLRAAGSSLEGRPRDLLIARILARQGRFYQQLSLYDRARALLEESLGAFRRMGARGEMAFPLHDLGVIAYKVGDYAEALRFHRECLDIYQELGDRRGIADCYKNLGNVASVLKQYEESKHLYQESLSIYQALDDHWSCTNIFNNLGIIAHELGEYAEARRLHRRCLATYRDMGDRWGVALALNNLGFALYELGRCSQAEECFHQALKTAVDIQAIPLASYALVGIATLLTREGEKEHALELVFHATCQSGNCAEIQERAEQLRSELEPQLPAQVVASAQEKGRARSLEYFPPVMGADYWMGINAKMVRQ